MIYVGVNGQAPTERPAVKVAKPERTDTTFTAKRKAAIAAAIAKLAKG